MIELIITSKIIGVSVQKYVSWAQVSSLQQHTKTPFIKKKNCTFKIIESNKPMQQKKGNPSHEKRTLNFNYIFLNN